MKAASVSNLDRAVACEMSTMATNKTGRIAVGTKETTPVVLAGFVAGWIQVLFTICFRRAVPGICVGDATSTALPIKRDNNPPGRES